MMARSDGAPGAAAGGIAGASNHFVELLTYGAYLALGLHAAFVPLFLLLDVPALALSNAASLAVYGLCLRWLRQGYASRALLTATFEIALHAVAIILLIGWKSGFHYYLILLVPVGSVNPRWTLAVRAAFAAGLAVFYVGLGLASSHLTPFYPIAAVSVEVVSYLNIAAAILALGYLAHHFNRAVEVKAQQLSLLATTDVLTGLSNRRELIDRLERETARQRRSRASFAVVLGDFDNFKVINDRFGHDCGDRVLVEGAEAMRRTLRAQDTLGRWGGEEFLALLPDTGAEGARAAAEKMRKAVEQTIVACGGHRIPVQITLGVSECLPAESLDQCLARADRALLQGKREGKNRVVTGTD